MNLNHDVSCPLRKNNGTQSSIWWRWFKQEGWIFILAVLNSAILTSYAIYNTLTR